MIEKNIFSTPTRIILAKDYNSNDFSALISEDKLRFFLNDLCGAVKYPVTVIEFNAEDNYKQKRIDSELSGITLRPSCDLFRKCVSGEYCKKCDYIHASLFKELKISDFPHILQNRIDNKEYNNDIYSKCCKKAINIKIEDKNRYYIEYNCPMLGYRELAFPIIFGDVILGALLIGQIKLEERIDEIREHKEIFFKEYPDILDGYIDKTINDYCKQNNVEFTKEEYKKEIQNLIINKGSRASSNNKFPIYYKMEEGFFNPLENDLINSYKYQRLIETICTQLTKFEERIISEFLVRKEKYIRDTVDNMIVKFEEKVRDIESTEMDINNLWSNVADKISNLVYEFGLNYIEIYGSDIGNNAEFANKLKLVAIAHDNKNIKDNEKYYYLDKLPNECFRKSVSSIENEHLFDGLDKDYRNNLNNTIILLFPVSYNKKSSNVVVIGFQEFSHNRINFIQQEIKKMLCSSMLLFTAVVFSNLLAIAENITQNKLAQQNENTIKTLRMYRHEISHLSLALRNINNKYFGNHAKISDLDEEKLRIVHEDIDSLLNLFNYMSGNTQIFTQQYRKLNKSYFSVFKELIYKWEQIYKLENEAKCKYFTYSYPDVPIEINSDKFLLEQIIYNLINNAVKYSHWGTNINISFEKELQYSNIYIFTIIDYGMEIDNTEKIYDLFYRSPNVEYYDHFEGSGIGLYIAKQAALAINAKISHMCELISKFNVPLLQSYLDMDIGDYVKDDIVISKKEVIKEIEKLKKEKIYDKIICKVINKNKLTSNRILQTLTMPTYKVKFEVIL